MAAARAFGEVVKYATAARCRRASLLQHFGESLPCGRRAACCDVCSDAEAVGQQVCTTFRSPRAALGPSVHMCTCSGARSRISSRICCVLCSGTLMPFMRATSACLNVQLVRLEAKTLEFQRTGRPGQSGSTAFTGAAGSSRKRRRQPGAAADYDEEGWAAGWTAGETPIPSAMSPPAVSQHLLHCHFWR